MNCSQIYIGVNSPLQKIDGEVFSVEQISSSDDEYLKLKLALNVNYIYYLAPHTGCGCGWEVTDTETEFDDLSKKSLIALKTYLHDLFLEQSIYVLTCNQNSIGAMPDFVIEIDGCDFLSILNELRPKFGETYARLYLLKLGKLSIQKACEKE